jgi:signal transduction histidine kinase
MFKRHTSIRQKIRAGYIVTFLILLVITLIIFCNLISIEYRLSFYAVNSRFLDITLEARRFEKNYFLYRKKEDLLMALSYIKAAEGLIEENRIDWSVYRADWLDELWRGDQNLHTEARISSQALELLASYREMLSKDFSLKRPSTKLEKKIREKGHALTKLAEELTETETRKIYTRLSATKKSLVFSVILFLLGSILIARMISRVVIRPLKEMEQGMKMIVLGNFEMLSLNSTDNEIVSVNTAFNHMIRELYEQRQEIIRSEKMASIGTMLAGIAHEINNPLSNISTSAEILYDELNEKEGDFNRVLVQQIVTETYRARDIIKTILEFTRESKFEKKEINLLRTMRATMLFIRAELPSSISVTLNIDRELSIFADKQKMLQQAFINLFKNSIDSIIDKGTGGEIRIDADQLDSNYVEMRLSDTGKGIPERLLGKIFDPFFSTKDVGKGTGLGLYLTHRIIDQHHGSIKVESQVGKGTTFRIRLPSSGDGRERKG